MERDTDSLSPDSTAALWRELAMAYGSLHKDRDAERLWRRLAEHLPDDIKIRQTLFDLALRAGDDTAAIKALDEIRRIEGDDGASWRFGGVALLIERVRRSPKDLTPLVRARRDLEAIAVARPSWARVPLALAEIDELSGNVESAIRNYLRAILEMGERDPAVIGRVAQSLHARQRFSEAELVLRKLKDERMPLSGELQRLSAHVSFTKQDYDRAVRQAERVVSDQSVDYRDLLWLGQLRWGANQDPEPAFRRAVSLAENVPETWLALLMYLADNGRKKEAEETLRRCEQALPKAEVGVALALGEEVLGNIDRARKLYGEALAAHPTDLRVLRATALFHLRGGRLAEAEPILARMTQASGTSSDRQWARRLLARIQVDVGGRAQSLRALEILGAGSASISVDVAPEDLRTKAKILALDNTRASRKEAIGMVEGLVDRGIASVEDLFLLAQLHESDGDGDKARQRMRELVAMPGGESPVYLAEMIRLLLRHGRNDDARAYLPKLEKAAPKHAGTMEAKARVLAALGKGDEVVALLTGAVRENAANLTLAAGLLESLDHVGAAEALYRRALIEQPEAPSKAVLELAGLLGRQGRSAEALDLLDARGWGSLPSPEVANTAVVVLYGALSSEPRTLDRVSRRIEEAIRANPRNVSQRFDLANVHILRGRHADAEAIFREIHERDKTHPAPLNNLGWMLALRGRDASVRAVPLVNEAIRLEGESPDLLDTRALVYIASGRGDDAIHDLLEAIKLNPTGSKYFHLARAYLLDGRLPDAADAFTKAKELGLNVGKLHPMERESFRDVVRRLAKP
jgi:tetratricopeptide (TPR) repeat protein